MDAHASLEFHGDAQLGALLDALEPNADKPLVLEYDGHAIQPGYHVTEVKAGSFATLAAATPTHGVKRSFRWKTCRRPKARAS